MTVPVLGQETKPLTNDDVLAMVKAGLSAEIITAKIKASPDRFDTSPTTLAQLKNAGVPDGVILAMVEAVPTKQADSQKAPDGGCSKYISSSGDFTAYNKCLTENGHDAVSTQPRAIVGSSYLPPNRLKAIAWRGVPWVSTSYYQQPGSASTNCSGSGTWYGNMSQTNLSCSTQYTPAQSVPMNWSHYTVYNLVETSNSYIALTCTSNWRWSKCSHPNSW